MRTTFVKTVTEDKLLLHGLLFEPDQLTEKIVIHIHGMAGNFYVNNFIHTQAEVFTQNGWSFLTTNNRGLEHITEAFIMEGNENYKLIGVHNEKFSECVFDIKAWIDFITEKNYQNTILQGHSLGACKVVYYISTSEDLRIKKLLLAAPPDMIAITEKWDKHKTTLETAKKMIFSGEGDKLTPDRLDDWYYLTANTYVDFTQRGNPIDVFNLYDPLAKSILEEVKIPMLAIYGSLDFAPVIPPKEALEILKKKSVNCPDFKSSVIENTDHSFTDHEEDMAKQVLNWLK